MIKQVVMAKNSYFSVRLDLFGPYFRTTPKVFIAINNRKSFLLKLKTAFKTYNLIKRLEAKTLPVFIDNLDKEVIKNLPKEYFRLRKIHFFDTEKWHQPEHMGYSYILPRFMVAHPLQKNIYYLCKNQSNPKEVKDGSELDQKCFFSFQVSRNIPLAVKENMGPKKNLEFYAYELLIEWLGFKNKGFTVDESTTYQKRLQLTNDSAQWSGHYIKAIGWDNNSHTNEIFYIMVFRRCYIPPMIDVFDDIVCMGMLTWKDEERSSNNLTSIARRTQDLYQYLTPEGEMANLTLGGNTPLQDRLFLTFADSVTCVEDQYPVPKDYIAYISQVVNSLGYGEDDYHFFKNTYQITPFMYKEKIERMMEYIRANFQSAETSAKDGDFFSKFLPENQRMQSNSDSLSSTPALTFVQSSILTPDEEYPKTESMSEDERKKADAKTRAFQIKLLDYITYNINR